jgi:putative Holliday junction resolvase
MADEPQERREVRILALDVGEKRIGLAVSDPLGITAQGLEVLIRQDHASDLERLVKVAREWRVQLIVVGLPRHMDGRLGTAAPKILELAEVLKKTLGVEVVTWEERLTTVEAERVLIQADVSRRRRRQVVDQLAAVLILQNYLDHCHLQGTLPSLLDGGKGKN